MPRQFKMLLQWLTLMLAGAFIIFISSKIHSGASSQPGEYYYSGFLKNNFNYLSGALFFLAALLISHLTHLKVLFIGLSLISVFLLACLYEMIRYRNSHNLLPFELVMYGLFALPAFAGALSGKWMNRMLSRNQRH